MEPGSVGPVFLSQVDQNQAMSLRRVTGDPSGVFFEAVGRTMVRNDGDGSDPRSVPSESLQRYRRMDFRSHYHVPQAEAKILE